MSLLVKETQNELRTKIIDALGRAVAEGELPVEPIPDFNIEKPTNSANGDFSANVALAGAKSFKKSPRDIAISVVNNIDLEGTLFEKVEIAGPGFLNFYLSQKYYSEIVKDVINKGENYGKSNFGKNKKVVVEFVSANPTGPMHIGNARGGAIGDCLSSVLEWAGYDVSREFYVNDAGNQIEKFAVSLEARYLQIYKENIEMPQDAYQGADITEHAKNFALQYGSKYVDAPSGERKKALVDYALPKNIEGLEKDLLQYRIKYDNWFKESTLHKDGSVDNIIKKFKSLGVTYEKDGALWFKASEFGNDKDVVLIRANGIPTYIVPDIAYHYNKLVTRGYNKAVDVLGADHHGYVPRMKAALSALGIDSSRLDCIIMQMVRLVRNGEIIKLSKRSGKAITLTTLLDEIPIDAARFFFNLREPNSHFDFDLDLAAQETNQNPVYYVQYAHARICSILKKTQNSGIVLRTPSDSELLLLDSDEEKELIRHLSSLTDEIIGAAKAYDPAKITHFVIELATLFHKFYNARRVMVENEGLMQARLYLCTAVKSTIKNILSMLKIAAPETM
ncbi:MAG: arginine--tRNA ligase [Clostridiales bacterium]|nr:arginine--tRNA ligase [Clostridiales bacterium]